MTIGERIKERRKRNGLTQGQLAELTGFSGITVFRWEAGQRSPRAEELARLASVLHTTVAYLMGLEEGAAPPEPVPAPGSLSEIPNSSPAKEPAAQQTNTGNRGILTYTFSNGEKLELPATPEGFALFERMVAQGRRITTEAPKLA